MHEAWSLCPETLDQLSEGPEVVFIFHVRTLLGQDCLWEEALNSYDGKYGNGDGDGLSPVRVSNQTEEDLGQKRRPGDHGGRNWSDAATSQRRVTGCWKGQRGWSPPCPQEEAQPSQHRALSFAGPSPGQVRPGLTPRAGEQAPLVGHSPEAATETRGRSGNPWDIATLLRVTLFAGTNPKRSCVSCAQRGAWTSQGLHGPHSSSGGLKPRQEGIYSLPFPVEQTCPEPGQHPRCPGFQDQAAPICCQGKPWGAFIPGPPPALPTSPSVSSLPWIKEHCHSSPSLCYKLHGSQLLRAIKEREHCTALLLFGLRPGYQPGRRGWNGPCACTSCRRLERGRVRTGGGRRAVRIGFRADTTPPSGGGESLPDIRPDVPAVSGPSELCTSWRAGCRGDPQGTRLTHDEQDGPVLTPCLLMPQWSSRPHHHPPASPPPTFCEAGLHLLLGQIPGLREMGLGNQRHGGIRSRPLRVILQTLSPVPGSEECSIHVTTDSGTSVLLPRPPTRGAHVHPVLVPHLGLPPSASRTVGCRANSISPRPWEAAAEEKETFKRMFSAAKAGLGLGGRGMGRRWAPREICLAVARARGPDIPPQVTTSFSLRCLLPSPNAQLCGQCGARDSEKDLGWEASPCAQHPGALQPRMAEVRAPSIRSVSTGSRMAACPSLGRHSPCLGTHWEKLKGSWHSVPPISPHAPPLQALVTATLTQGQLVTPQTSPASGWKWGGACSTALRERKGSSRAVTKSTVTFPFSKAPAHRGLLPQAHSLGVRLADHCLRRERRAGCHGHPQFPLSGGVSCLLKSLCLDSSLMF
ncbi:hypothetical protein Cadr_000019872 [Camelus dromedarius]|uniref:Uncharacterized protein n=1 Tax=Camelus dromedarius TaxID=9838 RepID=A0A5N4D5I4_CAMDR|nr:hypothetical protein Cadr_000019872 [Camelus dromedarius]